MNRELLNYAFKNVRKRKLRSSLTVLSILIGVMAIYALVSFGAGLQNYVDRIAQDAGADKIFIQARGIGAPGTDENFFISRDDAEFVDRINGVDELAGMYMSAVEIEKDRGKKFVFGIGLDTDKIDFANEAFTFDVEHGRNLKPGDVDKVVLGYNYQVADKIFSKPIVLGEKVTINGKIFDVAGFYEAVGNPQDDSNIYMGYEAFEQMFPEKKDKFGWVMVRANKDVNPSELAERIHERLRKHKDQEEGKEDFYVQTFEDALAIFNNVILVLNGILVLIALVSVIVAGVNTANTMYTAVLERTKEIGVMKAVGAQNKDIMSIFIAESGMLGLIGGILGIILGFLISTTGGAIAAAAGFGFLKPAFPIWLTASCLIFSFCIGAVSGTLPAVRAAKLQPVDALRYE
ncbi:ABC transporter permease [Candidatus Woesearchaeota archaeon]|nr:ABC transporter permease [Candidatus Woesearchaeota archaeon]